MNVTMHSEDYPEGLAKVVLGGDEIATEWPFTVCLYKGAKVYSAFANILMTRKELKRFVISAQDALLDHEDRLREMQEKHRDGYQREEADA